MKRYIINVFSCVVLFASNLVLKHLKFLKNFPLSGTFFWSKFSQYWYNFTSKNLFVNSTRLVGKMMLRNCISHYQQKPGCSQWDIKQREKKQSVILQVKFFFKEIKEISFKKMYILFAQSIATYTISLFSFQNILLLLTRCYQTSFYWYGNNATRSCEILFIYLDWRFLRNEPNPISAFPVAMGFFESSSTRNLSPLEAEPKQSNIPELFGNSDEPNSSVM